MLRSSPRRTPHAEVSPFEPASGQQTPCCFGSSTHPVICVSLKGSELQLLKLEFLRSDLGKIVACGQPQEMVSGTQEPGVPDQFFKICESGSSLRTAAWPPIAPPFCLSHLRSPLVGQQLCGCQESTALNSLRPPARCARPLPNDHW